MLDAYAGKGCLKLPQMSKNIGVQKIKEQLNIY
jgi:hypothetical protein